MNLLRLNEWWTTKALRKELVGKRRDVFYEIERYLDKRQILLLKGARRVGKTTIIHQIIDSLIREVGVNPYRILYFSFDEGVESLDDVLAVYQAEVLKESFSSLKERCYILFDEIQKLPDWPNRLKVFYDLYPQVKFIVSGSAAVGLVKGVNESLAGRAYDFSIGPLGFKEYLIFKGVHIEEDRLSLFRDTLIPHAHDYLKNSGFIEMMDETDEEVLRKYFQESILERVVYKDIPEAFSIVEPALLYKILRIVASHPGMIVEYNHLSNDLGRDQRTVSAYFEYLKASFLLKPLYSFSRNLIVSERRLKKYYLPYTSFSYFLSDGLPGEEAWGRLMENLFVGHLGGEFFYRSSTGEEVDIVLLRDGGRFVPVEIKWKDKIISRDIRGLRSFMRKYDVRRGYLISRNEEDEIENSHGTIVVIPYWKALLTDIS
jgi:predicted AAA+ superfamily ATPase